MPVYQHKQGVGCVFTKRYGCKILVYYEHYDDMVSAITREKKIKAGSRQSKLDLIQAFNPDWKDLYETLNN
jgi:putative endonuclease